jgi:hypothetical protein
VFSVGCKSEKEKKESEKENQCAIPTALINHLTAFASITEFPFCSAQVVVEVL